MSSLKLRHYHPYAPSYAPRIGKEEWESHKDLIVRLHESGMKRADIMKVLDDDYGFRPSLPQMNAKFKEWNLRVYGQPGIQQESLPSVDPSDVPEVDLDGDAEASTGLDVTFEQSDTSHPLETSREIRIGSATATPDGPADGVIEKTLSDASSTAQALNAIPSLREETGDTQYFGPVTPSVPSAPNDDQLSGDDGARLNSSVLYATTAVDASHDDEHIGNLRPQHESLQSLSKLESSASLALSFDQYRKRGLLLSLIEETPYDYGEDRSKIGGMSVKASEQNRSGGYVPHWIEQCCPLAPFLYVLGRRDLAFRLYADELHTILSDKNLDSVSYKTAVWLLLNCCRSAKSDSEQRRVSALYYSLKMQVIERYGTVSNQDIIELIYFRTRVLNRTEFAQDYLSRMMFLTKHLGFLPGSPQPLTPSSLSVLPSFDITHFRHCKVMARSLSVLIDWCVRILCQNVDFLTTYLCDSSPEPQAQFEHWKRVVTMYLISNWYSGKHVIQAPLCKSGCIPLAWTPCEALSATVSTALDWIRDSNELKTYFWGSTGYSLYRETLACFAGIHYESRIKQIDISHLMAVFPWKYLLSISSLPGVLYVSQFSGTDGPLKHVMHGELLQNEHRNRCTSSVVHGRIVRQISIGNQALHESNEPWYDFEDNQESEPEATTPTTNLAEPGDSTSVFETSSLRSSLLSSTNSSLRRLRELGVRLRNGSKISLKSTTSRSTGFMSIDSREFEEVTGLIDRPVASPRWEAPVW